MKSFLKKLLLPSLLAIAVLAVAGPVFADTYTVSGYAWSDMPNASDQGTAPDNHYGGRGLGWIQLKGSNYGVTLSSDGKFGGYAWNEYGGYVQFNPVNPAGQSDGGAYVDPTCLSGITACPVKGWIRFVSAPADPQSGGWDGWVKMSDASWSNGVVLGAPDPVTNIRTMSGFAWGDTVVGWVDFKYAQVLITPDEFQCPVGLNPYPDVDPIKCVCPGTTEEPINGECPVVPPTKACLDPLSPNFLPISQRDPAKTYVHDPIMCTYPPVKACLDPNSPDFLPVSQRDPAKTYVNDPTMCTYPPVCPIPNYIGMPGGYRNDCACKPRDGHPADCPVKGCKIDGDPYYNQSANTRDDSMCFCPLGDYNNQTKACGSCPNPNYPAGTGHPASSGYDNTCRCISSDHPEYCPTRPGGPRQPIYIET